MKLNYIIIPLAAALVAWAGSLFTSAGIATGWYAGILKPSWTPPGAVIGIVWTVIFILSAISALIVWNGVSRGTRVSWIVGIFLANAALNIFWSYLFFSNHSLGLATVEAGVLGLSVIALIILIWPISKLASILLMPYAAWVAFATYLTSLIWGLNK